MHYLTWKDHFRQDLFVRAQGSEHGHPILACAPCDKLYFTKVKMSTHVFQHKLSNILLYVLQLSLLALPSCN